jgi:hypothetical protein
LLAATLYQGNNEIAEMLVKSRYATTINDGHKPATKPSAMCQDTSSI